MDLLDNDILRNTINSLKINLSISFPRKPVTEDTRSSFDGLSSEL